MNAIVERRGTTPSMIAGFAAALALHGLALLSFVTFESPATSSVDTGDGGLVVMMGDAGGVTAQTVAENIQAAEASGVPDGDSVEEVVEQTVAPPPGIEDIAAYAFFWTGSGTRAVFFVGKVIQSCCATA